jgi:CheY-like chemotaxis protein
MEKISAEVLTNQKEIEVSEEISLLGAVVLLVEDNEVNQLVAKQFLAKKEIRVVVAGNGLIALEKIKSMEFDLVLMDLQMPVMDGYEAAMKIRSLSGKYFQEVPIIALTASTMSEVRKKVLTSGMNDYISKPFVPDTFYSCLYKYIQKSPIRSKDFSNSEDVEDIIQYDKVLQFSFGEMTFYKELLEKIKEEFKTFQVQFYAAACENNLEKISFLKHRLSSSLKILGQEDLDSEIESVRVLISNNNPPENVMDQAGSIKNSCLDIIKSIERELEKSSQENYN